MSVLFNTLNLKLSDHGALFWFMGKIHVSHKAVRRIKVNYMKHVKKMQ